MGSKLAIAFTDMHLGIPTLDNRMFWAMDNFMTQIESIQPSVAICLGDVFHMKKPTSASIEYATQWFKRLSTVVDNILIIPGNHDIDAFTGSTAVDFLDDIAGNIEIFYEPTERMDMLFVPYQRVLSTKTRLKIRSMPQVFMHQGLDVAVIYGDRMYGDRPDAVSSEDVQNHDLVLCGHIHRPLYCDNDNVYLPGSPYQIRYVDPMLVRGFGLWTLNDPSDFQMVDFENNFYLNKMVVTSDGTKVKEQLLSLLPSPAESTYYDLLVTLEGKATAKDMEWIKDAAHSVYGDMLERLNIVSVLPQSERTFYETMKSASIVTNSLHTPGDMLAAYMTGPKTQSFFKNNPDLVAHVTHEFQTIVSHIDEVGKGVD